MRPFPALPPQPSPPPPWPPQPWPPHSLRELEEAGTLSLGILSLAMFILALLTMTTTYCSLREIEEAAVAVARGRGAAPGCSASLWSGAEPLPPTLSVDEAQARPEGKIGHIAAIAAHPFSRTHDSAARPHRRCTARAHACVHIHAHTHTCTCTCMYLLPAALLEASQPQAPTRGVRRAEA